MKNLIRLQLRNVFHNKLFYVCLALAILMSPIASFIISSFVSKSSPSTVFSEIMGFMNSEISIISSVFIALFCCFDFNEGTTKNMIARGFTRTQVLFSKYIVTLIALFLMYIIISLLFFILFIKNGLGFESNMIGLLASDFIGIIACTIFFATMAFLLEKNGSAIIACMFAPTIISLVLGFVDSALKINTSKYWLENIGDIFTKNPTFTTFCLTTVYYLIYIFLFILIGIKILNKKEIK